MGLAASQARLLSITSRLSDNELRTQLINNQKMRLATESSRASEDYINALNSSTMMMTNYNAVGDQQTQALTYNSLTRYSSQNNQYGLVDANGKLLVGEDEAKLFNKSGGDLDKYLELHGLKYSTSYFSPTTFGGDPVILTDENGEEYAKFTVDELEKMYLGGTAANGNTYNSYDATGQSQIYNNYQKKYGEYDQAITDYTTAYWNAINSKLDDATTYRNNLDTPLKDKGYNEGLSNLNDKNSEFQGGTQLTNYLEKMSKLAKNLTLSDSSLSNIIKNFATSSGYTIDGNYVKTGQALPGESEGKAKVTYKKVGLLGNYYLDQIYFGSIEDDSGNFRYSMRVKDDAITATTVRFFGENGTKFEYICGGISKETKIEKSNTTGSINKKDQQITMKEDYILENKSNVSFTYNDNGTITVTPNADVEFDGLLKFNAYYYEYINDEKTPQYVGNTTKNKNGEETFNVQDYYAKAEKVTDSDGNVSWLLKNNFQIFDNKECKESSTKIDNKQWDHDAGIDNEESYSLHGWEYMTGFRYTDEDGNMYIIDLKEVPTGKKKNGNTEYIEQKITKCVNGNEILKLADSIREYLMLHITEDQDLFNIEEAKRILTNCGTDYDFNNLQKKVYEYIDSMVDGRTKNADGSYTFKNDDYEALYEAMWKKADQLGDIKGLLKEFYNDDRFNTLLKNNENFKEIMKQGVLETLFDTYGEPKMTWVDQNNNSEDGTKKAEWYTNLFNRMKQGYKVLEDGLASSNSWLQYALESGAVSIAQVDKAKNWIGTVYKNVKEISEVVDDAAVAVAEAEYNKAMNDIESKDKRFDMELKNIDTEHSALQQEYESIKSVLSKNVERTFKIFS